MNFLGRGWSFPPRFDADRRAVMVAGVEDIEESLRILFRTRRGERVMQHAYGTALHQIVFEVINDHTLTELRVMLEKAVVHFEPRIELERLAIRVSEDDLGTLLLELDYHVRTTNTRHNMIYPLYLDQATHPVLAG
ncbi:MAG: GPW/gp25 family protein [Mitsuaria chitosanitabida]|uniref:GPW/gp25 family protein n=1 Tax=Roseateles chitosanitabidus TaxID=65048 RepID=UPI001B27A885|nr:GPW/gp25 family protein [Roseateles chitosanitabidus]MBO9689440.1 GPW/gp25 family protein [Roseateles chitosanitabidus]